MRARILAGAVLVMAFAFLLAGTTGASGSSGPTTLGRTSWQVTRPYSPVHTPYFGQHGNIGFYNYIPSPGVPGQSDASWSDCGAGNSLCPNADTIGMSLQSRLYPWFPYYFSCLSSADFTFFQSLVSIPAGTTISQFSVNMGGADDGARVAIYNSAYPGGFVFPGSYIYLGGAQSTSDLSPYMVAGEVNRVVITQVDDCWSGNNLNYAAITLNGQVVPPKPADTTPPVDAPVVSPAPNGAGWNNTDVSVDWNWTDAGSGVDTANCTQTSDSSGEGTQTLTSTCTDLAGNSTSDSVTVNVDKTAPTITGSASPAPNGAGWNNTPVTVSFTCADNAAGSGIATDTVAGSTLSTDGANQSVTSTGDCIDAAGNAAASATVSGISIDQTAPGVSYSGNAGTYGVDQTVAITCAPSDALSGVASSTCADVNGSAVSFGLGTHSYSASATDNAGNTGSGSTSFTVVVTYGGLCGLVQQWVSNAGIANSLCVKLNAAAAATARGQSKTAANNIAAFDNEVSAQSGKALTAAHAATLISLASHL